MKKIRNVLLALLAAGTALAQGPRGFGTPGLDMTRLQTIAGAVTSIDMNYGAQYPSIVVNRTAIKTAPVWFFLDRDFELKIGDQLQVTAAPSRNSSDPYFYAVEITNTASKATIALRDAGGVPLWAGSRASSPGGASGPTGGGCLDPGSIQTVTGVVEKVTAGTGIQMPVLALKTAAGELMSMKIGPERLLLAADFELRVGDPIQARIALASCTDEYVVLQLTNAAGVTVVLRDDNGTPAWNR